MKLALNIGYSGAQLRIPIDTILEAERLGFDSVWSAEAYGSDAITPLAWIAAKTTRIKLGTGIMQIAGRTPAMCAMQTTTVDALSGGRMLVGLGLSGPQVIEGWHGVPYGKPMARVREYVEILRKIWAREEPVTYEGEEYQLPYRGPRATGLGKPLKSILHGRQLPVYLATMGPKNIQATAELADGWLPILFHPERAKDVWGADVDAGLAKRSAELGPLDVIAGAGWEMSAWNAGTHVRARRILGQSMVERRPKRSESHPPSREQENVAAPPTTVAVIAASGGIFRVAMAKVVMKLPT